MKTVRQKQREAVRIHGSTRARAGIIHRQFCVRWYEDETRKQRCFARKSDAEAFAKTIRDALRGRETGTSLLTVEVDLEVASKLEKLASAEGVSVSEIVRRAMRRFSE